MQSIFSFLIRLVLLAAGLLFAVSLLVVAVLFMALWGLRAGWARITGQPVTPFVMRVNPRSGFRWTYRTGTGAGNARPVASEPATPGRREQLPDVTDVEPKPPRN